MTAFLIIGAAGGCLFITFLIALFLWLRLNGAFRGPDAQVPKGGVE